MAKKDSFHYQDGKIKIDAEGKAGCKCAKSYSSVVSRTNSKKNVLIRIINLVLSKLTLFFVNCILNLFSHNYFSKYELYTI